MKTQAKVKKKSYLIHSILLVLSLMIIAVSTAHAKDSVLWVTYSKDIFKKAQQENKMVLVYGYSPSCQYCKMMSNETFTNPRVVSKIASKYIAAKLNTQADRKNADFYGMFIVPTVVIMQPDGRIIDAIYGFHDADELLQKI